MPPSSYVFLIVLTHLNCVHLSLINIPFLVYSVSVFPFLCASSCLFSVSSVPAFFLAIFTVPGFLIPAC